MGSRLPSPGWDIGPAGHRTPFPAVPSHGFHVLHQTDIEVIHNTIQGNRADIFPLVIIEFLMVGWEVQHGNQAAVGADQIEFIVVRRSQDQHVVLLESFGRAKLNG